MVLIRKQLRGLPPRIRSVLLSQKNKKHALSWKQRLKGLKKGVVRGVSYSPVKKFEALSGLHYDVQYGLLEHQKKVAIPNPLAKKVASIFRWPYVIAYRKHFKNHNFASV